MQNYLHIRRDKIEIKIMLEILRFWLASPNYANIRAFQIFKRKITFISSIMKLKLKLCSNFWDFGLQALILPIYGLLRFQMQNYLHIRRDKIKIMLEFLRFWPPSPNYAIIRAFQILKRKITFIFSMIKLKSKLCSKFWYFGLQALIMPK